MRVWLPVLLLLAWVAGVGGTSSSPPRPPPPRIAPPPVPPPPVPAPPTAARNCSSPSACTLVPPPLGTASGNSSREALRLWLPPPPRPPPPSPKFPYVDIVELELVGMQNISLYQEEAVISAINTTASPSLPTAPAAITMPRCSPRPSPLLAARSRRHQRQHRKLIAGPLPRARQAASLNVTLCGDCVSIMSITFIVTLRVALNPFNVLQNLVWGPFLQDSLEVASRPAARQRPSGARARARGQG